MDSSPDAGNPASRDHRDDPTPSDTRRRCAARGACRAAGAIAARRGPASPRRANSSPRQVVVKFEGQRRGRDRATCRRGSACASAAAPAAQPAGRLRGAQLHRHRLGEGAALPNRKSPTTPGRSPALRPARRLGLQAVELPALGGDRRRVAARLARRHRRGRRLGEPDRGRAARRGGHHGRGPRHRHRLPQRGQRASGAAPTSPPASSCKGYDFVDNDRLPLDENGHGTHIAGTIAEKTNNGIGLTGLAYRAKLMPVRVLDRHGSGRADDIAQGHPLRRRPRRRRDQHELQLRLRQGRARESTKSCAAPTARGRGDGGLDRQPGLGGLRLAAGHRAARDRRRRHHRGRLPRRLLAAPGRASTSSRPGAAPPVPGCPSISTQPIYQVTLKGGNTAPLRRAGQLRRHLDGGRARLRRRGDGPGQRRADAERLARRARSTG